MRRFTFNTLKTNMFLLIAMATMAMVSSPSQAAVITGVYNFDNVSPTSRNAIKTIASQPVNATFSNVTLDDLFELGGSSTEALRQNQLAFTKGDENPVFDYVEWALTAAPGFLIQVDSVSFSLEMLGGTARDVILQVSTDGFTSVADSVVVVDRTGDGPLSLTVDESLSAGPASTLSFRIGINNVGRNNGKHAIDTLTTNAQVIPEPTSIMLLLLAGAALCLRTRDALH